MTNQQAMTDFSNPTRFSIPDSAVEAALAGGLALLITGAAFVTRTQRRRPSTA
jgi:hypothetical protein